MRWTPQQKYQTAPTYLEISFISIERERDAYGKSNQYKFEMERNIFILTIFESIKKLSSSFGL